MSQVIEPISTSDRRAIDDYVGRMRSEYDRLEQLDANGGPIQPMDDTANHLKIQIVAAWDGESQLEESVYFSVRNCEMNANGFKLWLTERPTTPYFVLIVADNSVSVKVRVVDVQPDSTTGEELFIVETEFEGTM